VNGIPDVPDLERVVFFSGQRLAAADLAALERRQRELRWLHNRNLHAWGVASGLGVSGRRGETTVRIDPGYGTDAVGREIFLAEAVTKDVPAVAAESGSDAVFYLVAVYLPDSRQEVVETREGVCHPAGAVRLGDRPLLDWRSPAQVDESRHLVLARIWVRNCRLNRDVCTKVRRDVRPSLQPYVATGRTEPGATEWTPWTVQGQMVGVFTTVVTSAARFHTTPRYLFELAGDRYLEAPPGPLLAAPVMALAAATANRFQVRVLLPKVGGSIVNPAALRKPTTTPDLLRERMRWSVQWVGLEG
jgi:hypothetical protein